MSAPDWPPLITSRRMPAWIVARDVVLTLLAWMVLGWMLKDAILLVADWLFDPIFELTRQDAPDWARIWRRLKPFAAGAAVLSAWLSFWAAWRRKTLSKQFDPAQPPALAIAEQAGAFGLADAEVRKWRDWRVMTVHIDEAGRPTHAKGRGEA